MLDAPQLLAEMSLKTNKEMPVHGADGVHVCYCSDSQQLRFYRGESKLYQDVGKAVNAAVTSIVELELVERHIALTGLNDQTKAAIIKYLDPFEEESNPRVSITTCLIGFDFEGLGNLHGLKKREVAARFDEQAKAKLAELSTVVAKSLEKAGLESHLIEAFFLPLPSVSTFRDLFQDKIGWHVAAVTKGKAAQRITAGVSG